MFAFTLLLACAADPVGGDSADATDPGPGALSIGFGIDLDYRDVMDEPAVGRFWGTIYLADDVSGVGPAEGAQEYGSVHVAALDLSGAEGSASAVVVSDPIDADEVVILGFLDSDGNAAADAPDPDSRDPVTLPADNKFDVVRGETTEVQVWLGFLNP